MSTIDFKKEPKVEQWLSSIHNSSCTLSSLKPISLLHKSNGELLFALCDADVSDPLGNKLPRYIFIRGHACIIVVLITNSNTGDERFLMIRQRRIGNGALNLEFPAGMIDRDVNNIKNVAVKELFEETGISVSSTDLFPLNNGPLYSSAGASDEGIYFFGCKLTLAHTEFTALEGRHRGEAGEDEQITVTLCTKEEIESESTSIQARLALCLFEKYLINKRR